MRILAHSLRPSQAWRFIYRLTLVAFILRALVPVGFMPDPEALRDGRLALMLCAAGSPLRAPLHASQQVAHEAAGHDTDARHHPDDSNLAGADCPFGVLLVQALVPTSSDAAQVVPPVVRELVRQPQRNLSPLPAPGLSLGPRGPPLNL